MQIGEHPYHGYDWDAANEGKILAKHGLSKGQVERFFERVWAVIEDIPHSEHEPRHIALGRDEHGCLMMAVFTFRLKEGYWFLRPISARRMRDKEMKRYGKEEG